MKYSMHVYIHNINNKITTSWWYVASYPGSSPAWCDWRLASANNPLFEDLFVDSLSIIFMLTSYGMNLSSIMFTQQEDTKILIACANLLMKIDNSLFPLESDASN